MPLPVWGWSKPGATVTVEFAGQKESATAGADGKWMLKLKPLNGQRRARRDGGSGSAGNKVVLKNILVGEVWHASGQSNMEWFANKSNCCRLAQEIVEGAGRGADPGIENRYRVRPLSAGEGDLGGGMENQPRGERFLGIGPLLRP